MAIERIRDLFGRKRTPVILEPSQVGQVLPEATVQVSRGPDSYHKGLIKSYIEKLMADPNLDRAAVVDRLAGDPIFERVEPGEITRVINEGGDPEDVIKALGGLVSSRYSGQVGRYLRMSTYNLNNNGGEGRNRKKRRRKGQSQIEPVQALTVAENTRPARKIVIQKMETSVNLGDRLDDKRLLTEIRKSGSEIPEEEVLEIIAELQRASELELQERYKKRVKHGPFDRWREVRRGQTGRVLFFIDGSSNTLYLRLGSHDHIYGTRIMTRDPRRMILKG